MNARQTTLDKIREALTQQDAPAAIKLIDTLLASGAINDLLASDAEGRNVLHHALLAKDFDVAKHLLQIQEQHPEIQFDMGVDANQLFPILVAVRSGNIIDILRRLISISEKSGSMTWLHADKDGYTPLHEAAAQSRDQTVELLLACTPTETNLYPYVNRTSATGTALHKALRSPARNMKLVAALLNHGALLQMPDQDNIAATALYDAMSEQEQQALAALPLQDLNILKEQVLNHDSMQQTRLLLEDIKLVSEMIEKMEKMHEELNVHHDIKFRTAIFVALFITACLLIVGGIYNMTKTDSLALSTTTFCLGFVLLGGSIASIPIFCRMRFIPLAWRNTIKDIREKNIAPIEARGEFDSSFKKHTVWLGFYYMPMGAAIVAANQLVLELKQLRLDMMKRCKGFTFFERPAEERVVLLDEDHSIEIDHLLDDRLRPM